MLKIASTGGAAGPRLARNRLAADENGSILVSVMTVMLVLTVISLTLAAIVASTTHSATSSGQAIQSQAAADAGLADMVATAKREGVNCSASTASTVAPFYVGHASCDTTSGKVTFQVTGTANGASTTTQVVYSYTGGTQNGSASGALVSAGGSGLNISSINVRNNGDLVVGAGNFDCNNTTMITGNLIVRNGTVNISNTCIVGGSIYASGNVSINNLNSIGGDVVTLGQFTLNQGRVIGSVYAAKTVQITNGTVGGDLISASTGTASVYQGTIGGSIRIAGSFSSLQDSTVTGSVMAAAAGTNSIAPTTKIGGNLQLAGTISTWNSGPTVGGTTTTKMTGLVAPVVATPTALSSTAVTWVDYAYHPEDWSAHYNLVTFTKSQCDFQNQPAQPALVKALRTPTVIDARACDTLKLTLSTLQLSTDVVFIANKFDSSQNLTINSADGNPHEIDLITPDNTADGKPTCASNQGLMKIDDVHMASQISGMAYSPCEIHIGQSSSSPTVRWNGQIFAGVLTWGGNSGSADTGMQLYYEVIELPGFNTTTTGPTTTGDGTLGDLRERRDVT